MKQAVFVKKIEGWRADAHLYKLMPALQHVEDDVVETIEFVIVSAVVAFGTPETYIFPAKDDGEAISMVEMAGSFRGALDHAKALRNMGYEPVGPLLTKD